MADALQFKYRGSAERWLDSITQNAQAMARDTQRLFEVAAYAHMVSIELPQVEALHAKQLAEVDKTKAEMQSLADELAKFSDRAWLRKIFESQAKEDKRRQELEDELKRLEFCYKQARPVLDELEHALKRLRGVSMPEQPAWLQAYLKQ